MAAQRRILDAAVWTPPVPEYPICRRCGNDADRKHYKTRHAHCGDCWPEVKDRYTT